MGDYKKRGRRKLDGLAQPQTTKLTFLCNSVFHLPYMVIAPPWEPKSDTLSDWEWRAEQVDRSLPAYTPIPLTPSSMATLVHLTSLRMK